MVRLALGLPLGLHSETPLFLVMKAFQSFSTSWLPILLYIGMLIGAQAFQESPKAHAPAIILALVPHLAAWALSLINSTLTAAGTSLAEIDAGALAANGIFVHGLETLAGGAILSGLILAAIAIFIIDKNLLKAAGFALAGAVLSFFGFMHAESVGLAVAPMPAVAYFVVSLFLAVMHLSHSQQAETTGAPAAETGHE